MREAGIEVNDMPRIHIRDELIRESHSIMIPQVDLRIPLRLSGVFSYFVTRSLTNKEIEECYGMDMVLITPYTKVWDPHCDSYADHEDNFLDYQGELKHPPEPIRRKIIDERDYINYSMHDVEYEESIDAVIAANNCAPLMLSQSSHCCPYIDETVKFDDDPIRANLASVNICFDETLMAERFHDRLLQSKYAASIGSTSAANTQDPHVCEIFGLDPSDSDCHEYWYTPEDMINPQRSVSATHASKPKGINKEHIMKIWRVSEDEAWRTLEVTTQLKMQDAESNLPRALSTNDWMLHYRRINSFFFTDNFFGKKRIRGYTCMQLFVSDKGFVKVYGMKIKGQFTLALKLFTKEVGVPNAFILNPSGE